MSKREKTFSVSAGLLRLGDALRFSPEEGQPVPERKQRSFRIIPPEKLLGFKNGLARMREQSLFLSLADGFFRCIFLTRFRGFATLFFTSGLIQTVSYFIGSYLPVLSGDQNNLIIGLILIIMGLICAFERASFGTVLKRSVLFRRVIHPLFGVEEREIPDGKTRESILWMLGAGAVLGVFSIILSPYRVVLWLAFAVAAAVALYKPETGLVVSALLFPLLPQGACLGLIVLLHFSLIMKISVGKRSLVAGPADIPVLILMALMIIRGGVPGIPYAIVLSVYYLGLHLCRTALWLRRICGALVLSAGVASFAAVAMKLIARFTPNVSRLFPGVDLILSALRGREYVFLSIMLLPMMFCFANAGRGASTRAFGVLALLLAGLSLAAFHDAGFWLGAVVGLILALCLSHRWGLITSLFLGLAGYSGWMFLPETIRGRITVFLGLEEKTVAARTEALDRGRAYLKEALPWGMGRRMNRTELSGASAYSLAGAFGGYLVLAVLVMIFLWFFVRCVRFSSCGAAANIHHLVLGAMAGILVWLCCGIVSSTFAPEPLFLIALFLSFPKAAENACRREEYQQPY